MNQSTDSPVPPAKFPWWVLGLTLLIVGIVNFALLPKATPFSVDANTYLSGAISLAEGKGYHAATQLDHPPITIYPPGNSFYLSLFWRLNSQYPGNIPFLNAGMVLLSVGVCACLFLWLQRMKVPLVINCLLTLTLGLSPSWLTLLTHLFSDVLLALLAGLLWLIWWRKDVARPSTYWLTGLLLALCLLTRTAALAWIGAAGLILLWRFRTSRPWQWVALLLLPFLACVWWKLWTASGYSYGNYFQDNIQGPGGLAKYFNDTLMQAWRYLGGEHFFELLCPAIKRLGVANFTQNLSPVIIILLNIFASMSASAIIVLALLGCWKTWDRSSPYILIVFGVYLLELIVWPFSLGYRVIVPLAPALLYWAWAGYQVLGEKLKLTRWLVPIAATLLVANLLLNGALAVRLQREYAYPQKLEGVKEIAEWVSKHTKDSNRIAIDALVPQTHLHYLTDRLYIGGDAGYAPWTQPQMRVEYLIAGAEEQKLRLKPEMQARVIYQTRNGNYRVYQFGPVAK